jgi:hypothetical protein
MDRLSVSAAEKMLILAALGTMARYFEAEAIKANRADASGMAALKHEADMHNCEDLRFKLASGDVARISITPDDLKLIIACLNFQATAWHTAASNLARDMKFAEQKRAWHNSQVSTALAKRLEETQGKGLQ